LLGAPARKPVGIRGDCLGVLSPLPAWADDPESVYVRDGDPLVAAITERLSTAPVLTEWCQLPAGTDKGAYYEKGLRDTVKYHVAMTSSTGFPDQSAPQPMDPALFDLWSRTNKYAGYRYTVSVDSQPRIDKDGTSEWIEAVWTNSGAAAALEDWQVDYEIADASGIVVQRTGSQIALRSMVVDQNGASAGGEPARASARETVRIDRSGLRPGRYTVTAGVMWKEHKPGGTHSVDHAPMSLAQTGRTEGGRYPIAAFSVP
jgi:hypothetical protein